MLIFFFNAIVSLIRFPKIQTKQMTIRERTIGTNKSPAARLLTMRDASHPYPSRQGPTSIPPIGVSYVQKGQYLFSRARLGAQPLHNYLSPQISQINRRNYFSWLSTHISLGREQNKQLIFPDLFSEAPASLNAGYPGTCGSQSAAIRPEEKMNGLRAEGLICREPVREDKVTPGKFPVVGTRCRITTRLQHN